MNINKTATFSNSNPQASQLNFGSRNKVIRDADDVARFIRREFPMMSDTMMFEKGVQTHKQAKVYNYISGVVSELRGFLSRESSLPKSALIMLDAIKKLKVGNCLECSNITAIGFRANGYKDVKSFELCAFNPKTETFKDLGHAVVGINFSSSGKLPIGAGRLDLYVGGDKSIVVDNWLEKVDYAKQINYKKNQFFENAIAPEEIVCYVENGKANGLSDKDILFMEMKYPRMLRFKKHRLIKKIKYMFMDKEKYQFNPFEFDIIESYRTNLKFKKSLTREQLCEFLTRKARESDQVL